MAALRGAREVDAPRARRRRRLLPRPEADLVSAAHGGARLRREAARERPPGIRRLALARLLGAARNGDRLQARGLSPGADRAAPLPAGRPARAGAPPGVRAPAVKKASHGSRLRTAPYPGARGERRLPPAAAAAGRARHAGIARRAGDDRSRV